MQSGTRARATRSALRLEHAASIEELPAAEWDACLGDRGAFAVAGLRFLERLFGPHQPPENHWVFHYYRVADERDRPVLLTFFTEALWKDDMLAPAEVSAAAEERRRADPYHATSKMFAMGSLLTEGDHLFLARHGPWRDALQLMLEDVRRRAGESGAKAIALRDIPADDADRVRFLHAAGFRENSFPPSWVLHLHHWETDEEFVASLNKKRRHQIRKHVFPWNAHYSVRVFSAETEQPSAAELARLYGLYRCVHRRSYALNTFALPSDVLHHAVKAPNWELLVLRLHPELGQPTIHSVAFILSFQGDRHYSPLILGLDDRYVRTHALYRQCLWRIILRAKELGHTRVRFGIGAPVEKARFGCVSIQSLLFFFQ